MPSKLTKQEILREIVLCSKDPVYFVENYAKISHPIRGIIPFKLYPFQKEVLRDFRNNRFCVVLKARQMGISTLIAAYACWFMLFQKGKFILTIATQTKVAANLVKKTKRVYKNLPDWLRVSAIVVDSETRFALSNESTILASSTAGDAGRSEAVSLLIVDEAGHVEGIDELWTGLNPVLATGGACVALSSPNGAGNWFHQIYTDAEAGLNDFKPIRLHWSLHPERDQTWFENETKAMSRRQVAQEYEATFLMSGDSVISGEDIDRLEKACKDPIEKKGFDRNLWIWKYAQSGKRYMLVADTARGDGSDYSTFHVFNIDDVEIVAEYQGKLDIALFAMLIRDTALEYNGALVVPENNNLGYMTATEIIKLNYPNMYYEKKSTHEQVDAVMAESTANVVPGFNTNPKNRILLIAKFEEYVRMNVLKTYSIRTVNEMKTFIWKENRPEAMKNCHDDLIMALAIGCWIRDTVLTTSSRDTELKKALLNAMFVESKEFSTKIPGEYGYKPQNDPWSNQNDIKKMYRDFAWVLG